MIRKTLLLCSFLIFSCGNSSFDKKLHLTDVTQLQYFNLPIDADEDGVFLSRIEELGPKVEIRFKGQDGTDFSNLLRGNQLLVDLESASFGRQIVIACITYFNPAGDTHECVMEINGAQPGQAIRDINLAEKSFELIIGEPTQPDHDSIDNFLTVFNFESSADYEYHSSDSRFKLTYSASANEMKITFQEGI